VVVLSNLTIKPHSQQLNCGKQGNYESKEVPMGYVSNLGKSSVHVTNLLMEILRLGQHRCTLCLNIPVMEGV
jgi:hypothetical protein